MPIELLVIICTVLTGLLTWALNKVYTSVNDKIKLSDNLTGIRSEAMDAKFASGRCEVGIEHVVKRLDKMEVSVKILSEKSDVVIADSVETNRKNKTYGKIIKILHEDLKARKGG